MLRSAHAPLLPPVNVDQAPMERNHGDMALQFLVTVGSVVGAVLSKDPILKAAFSCAAVCIGLFRYKKAVPVVILSGVAMIGLFVTAGVKADQAADDSRSHHVYNGTGLS